MVKGIWTGTMNLTEPHCGTDLGLIRTKAAPNPPGPTGGQLCKITGTKIFISAGEHDLSADNIIHLVLAKTTGAPDNVKGISLFIVPKFLINEDGSLGARNAVKCGSIEHKMGIHANATCVMNYDGATGYMLGEENKGLRAMFIMMNAARLGVGVQGLARARSPIRMPSPTRRTASRAARSPVRQQPEAKADPIIVHADVRRMLMDGRAFNEGARALMPVGRLAGRSGEEGSDAEERQMADDLISLLTPVIKGYCTDKGYEIATASQQVLRRSWLYPRMGHGTVRPRRAHRPDLRRHQRHPGDGPGRPQAGAERRARDAGLSGAGQ
jgi:alkylation response protein AidB-like acyl-CoA dehydrogenase